MKKLLLIFCVLSALSLSAQIRVTVCQSHGLKDWIIFYKDGSDTAAGHQVSDSCTVYDIPVTEPQDIHILCEENVRHILHLWVDPRFGPRSVTIDNQTKELVMHDTIPVDIENAPYAALYRTYEEGRMTHDSFDIVEGKLVEQYIVAHPDSFLSSRYLQMFMYSWDIAKVTRLRDLIQPQNSKLATFRSVNNFIENYKYKNTPHIGDDFYEFTARRPDGSAFDSRAVSDKVIVIFFWYSGCGPCKRVIEPLAKLYDKYKEAGMELVSYATDDNEETWKKSCSQYKFPGQNVSELMGFSSPIANHYALNIFPSFVVFDKKKKISLMTYGEEIPLIESKVKALLEAK